MCPLGLHQGDEASDGPPPLSRSPNPHLHRRHADPSQVSSACTAALEYPSPSSRVSGFYHQCQEINSDSCTVDGVLGMEIDSLSMQVALFQMKLKQTAQRHAG